MKANFKKYVIKDNKITLSFSSWIFTRDEVFDFTDNEDLKTIEQLILLIEKELLKTECDLAFEYEGYNLQVGRVLAQKCLTDCRNFISGLRK